MIVVAVGGGDITPAAARLKIVLAHQAFDPLVVGDHASMAKRRLHAAPAIGFELVADRGDRVQQLDIANARRRRIIIR
nr:hypothetical protein [Nitrobacter hamburgensis]